MGTKGNNDSFPGKPGFARHVDARETPQEGDIVGRPVRDDKPLTKDPHGADNQKSQLVSDPVWKKMRNLRGR